MAGVDSLAFASAVALFSTSISTWFLAKPLRYSARLYLRFAAILFSALATASLWGLGDVAALLLLPLGAAALALSALTSLAKRPGNLLASIALIAALGAGLGAMVFGPMIFALAPVILASFAIMAAGMGALAPLGALSGIALLASALSDLEQGASLATMMFCAAALIGLAKPSEPAVEQTPRSARRPVVSGRL